MKEIKVLSALELIVAILLVNFFPSPLYAFDGTDIASPSIISFKLLSSPPTVQNERIAFEVLTQDDKNWVKINGTPQIGYSYVVSNLNAAPNCSNITTSFSKLEVVEDALYRNQNSNGNTKQRFFLIGFAPKPKPLIGNCPEYRNFNVRPAVALNTSQFITTTNKSTKEVITSSNLLLPIITDESGRSSTAGKASSIAAENISYIGQQPGISRQFCIPASLLPKINSSVASVRAKYFELTAKALDSEITYESDSLLDLFELQSNYWDTLTKDFNISNFEKIESCEEPVTAQQIITAYQAKINSLDSLLKNLEKQKLIEECNGLSNSAQLNIDLSNIITSLGAKSKEALEYITVTKNIKLSDCSKISSKQFETSLSQLKLSNDTLTQNQNIILPELCDILNTKRVKYLNTLGLINLRYKSTLELSQFTKKIENIDYSECNPNMVVSDFVNISKLALFLITEVNSFINQVINLEKQKKILITIGCKMGSKIITRKGLSPTCPNKYLEQRVILMRI